MLVSAFAAIIAVSAAYTEPFYDDFCQTVVTDFSYYRFLKHFSSPLQIIHHSGVYGKYAKTGGFLPSGESCRFGADYSSIFISRPSSCGRKRGQTFSDTVMTEDASRVPISTASRIVLP